MSYVVLARKWRPQSFGDVIGQEHVVQTIHNSILSGRVAHAFLFTGARGVGKTTAARLVAKALCCEKGPAPEPCNTCGACLEITSGSSTDVLEIDGASNTGVDDVRELRESARYLPVRLRLKIFIIDEVHMLSTSAFNALLKLLEEPPAHLKFIFATTEPHKIPITILSRCQRYDFKRIAPKVMADRLRHIAGEEGIEAEQGALELICKAAEGGMRDALSLMDQVLSYVGGGTKVTTLACVEALGIIDRRTIVALTEALLKRDAAAGLAMVREASARGFDLKELAQETLTELRHLAVAHAVKDPSGIMDLPAHEIEALQARARTVPAEEIHRLFNTFMQRVEALSRGGEPLLTFEMAVMGLCLAPPAASLQDVSDLVARLEAAAGGAPLAVNRPVTSSNVPAAAAPVVPPPAAPVTPPPVAPVVAAPPPAPVVAAPVVAAPVVAAPVVAEVKAPTPRSQANTPPWQRGQSVEPIPAAPVVAPAAPAVKSESNTPPWEDVAAAPVAAPVAVPVTPSAPVTAAPLRATDGPLVGADPVFLKIMERMQTERPALVAALDVARVSVEGNVLRLRFEQSFYLEMLRQPASEKALKDAVVAVMGEGATFDAVAGETNAGGTSLADIRDRERQEFEAARLERVKANPAVKLANELFGAKIREVKGLQ